MADANATQVGGLHYKVPYQHWDFVLDQRLGYYEGQITKYLARARKKNGKQDVDKSLHFAQKLFEIHSRLWSWPIPNDEKGYVAKFCESNGCDLEATKLITQISTWRSRADISAFLEDLTQYVTHWVALDKAFDNPHHGHTPEDSA